MTITATTTGTLDAVVARAVYGFPDDARTDALANVCRHLNEVFLTARALGDPGQLRELETEKGRVVARLPQYREWDLPVVRVVRMDSPLEIITQLPPEFGALGIPGLFYLAKRTMTFKLEVTERAERLRAEAARWERERTDDELRTLENYGQMAETQLRIDPPPEIELDEQI